MRTTPAKKLQQSRPRFRAAARNGWDAALLEIEHQAEHWDTPNHGETGRLIAAALRSAVDIARAGGLRCEHRYGQSDHPSPYSTTV
jgi:hypothetical protein